MWRSWTWIMLFHRCFMGYDVILGIPVSTAVATTSRARFLVEDGTPSRISFTSKTRVTCSTFDSWWCITSRKAAAMSWRSKFHVLTDEIWVDSDEPVVVYRSCFSHDSCPEQIRRLLLTHTIISPNPCSISPKHVPASKKTGPTFSSQLPSENEKTKKTTQRDLGCRIFSTNAPGGFKQFDLSST